ncbi:MAG: DUF433 domain-containing protein [Saprospiraceae bacterium]
MTALQQAEALLPQLSDRDIDLLLHKILVGNKATDFPGIEKTAGVCGGRACIIRTRIPVWSLVNWRHLGLSDAQLLEIYPSIRPQDLKNAWAYYETHRAEIDFDIRENEDAA